MAKATWKLVRDNIPSIIEADGRTPETRVVKDKQAHIKVLKKKLDEEVKELKQELTVFHNPNLDSVCKEKLTEEMADVLEVLAAITELTGIETEYLFAIADQKRKERGGFMAGVELKITK